MGYRRGFFGIFLALVLICLVAGAGLTAYNAGVSQGMFDSGRFAVPSGAAPAVPFYTPFGMYRPFGFQPFGFAFGFLRCLVPLFFILLLFMLFRFAFRPRWGRGWGAGLRGWDPTQDDIPPAVKEFHRKLHEQENQTPPPSESR